MTTLIDTQVMLWWLSDDARLGESTRRLISDRSSILSASMASLWEIAIKFRLGKLSQSSSDVSRWLVESGIKLIPFELQHFHIIESLPLIHRDPFDRMIVAQAIVGNLGVLTSDAILERYAITCIDATQ